MSSTSVPAHAPATNIRQTLPLVVWALVFVPSLICVCGSFLLVRPCRVHSHQEYMANHKFRGWFDKGDDGGSGWSILNREGRSKHRGVPIFNNAAAAQRGLRNLHERLHHRDTPDSELVRSIGSLLQVLRRRPVSQGDSDEETLTLNHESTQAPFEPFRRQSSGRGRTAGMGRTPGTTRRGLSEPPSETRPRSSVEQSDSWAWDLNDACEARGSHSSWEHASTHVSSSARFTWAGQQAAQANRGVWDGPGPPDPWSRGGWDRPGPPDLWSSRAGPPDSWSSRAGPPDLWSSRAGPPDSWSSRAGPPDLWSSRAGPPDSWSSRAGPPDLWSSRAGPPDLWSSRAGPPDSWSRGGWDRPDPPDGWSGGGWDRPDPSDWDRWS